jgi:hypothetical protein
MTWAMYHAQSEQYSNLAEEALRKRDFAHAVEYYRLAAEQETLALGEIDPGKKRTYGVTVVSAVSLWYKAHEYQQAQSVAYKGLANAALPTFAVKELQELLQYIWSEEARQKAGIDFTEGEVLVSVSGGEVVVGGAPLELILRKVDEVSKLFYRTIELLLDRPFRKRGAPSIEIQEQFRAWLFQVPAGSYQFAVRVERPKQMTLFPEAAPQVEQITHKFLQIVKASVDDPEGDLVELVPNQEYRSAFLKLTRNLAPTGKLFGQLEIKSPSDVSTRPIVLIPTSREVINKALRRPEREGAEQSEETVIKLRGVLRGLQLDNDWLDIDEEGQERKPIRIYEAGEAIDDVVGPMVNRRVVVDVVRKPSGKYTYRDIQMEE